MVTVNIVGEDSEPGTFARGVRQGSSLSPILLNIYVEAVMKEMEDPEDGIKVKSEIVKTKRLADNRAVVCTTNEGPQ